MAFMDMEPINEGHILLVPKQHYLDADEIPDEWLAHLMIVSKKIVTALKEIYHPNGYSIMQNGGEFNGVGQYHLHIFQRYVGDGFGWTYGSEEKVDRPLGSYHPNHVDICMKKKEYDHVLQILDECILPDKQYRGLISEYSEKKKRNLSFAGK